MVKSTSKLDIRHSRCRRRADLCGIVQDDVHELVVPAKRPDDMSVCVQLQIQALLHEATQIRSRPRFSCHRIVGEASLLSQVPEVA